MRGPTNGMFSCEAPLGFAPATMARLKDVARIGAVLALLAVLAYCLHTAWDVLGRLGTVKLAECSHALEVVTVRDGVLCVVGYRIGIELLRAVTRLRRDWS